VRKYASFIFRVIFQTTISSKDTSFGVAKGYQEKLGPQGRENVTTNEKDAKARGYKRDKTTKGDESLKEIQDITCTMKVKKKKIGECKIMKLGAIINN